MILRLWHTVGGIGQERYREENQHFSNCYWSGSQVACHKELLMKCCITIANINAQALKHAYYYVCFIILYTSVYFLFYTWFFLLFLFYFIVSLDLYFVSIQSHIQSYVFLFVRSQRRKNDDAAKKKSLSVVLQVLISYECLESVWKVQKKRIVPENLENAIEEGNSSIVKKKQRKQMEKIQNKSSLMVSPTTW